MSNQLENRVQGDAPSADETARQFLGGDDRAFDRLATWLRRPAGYDLVLSTSFQEKPSVNRPLLRATSSSSVPG